MFNFYSRPIIYTNDSGDSKANDLNYTSSNFLESNLLREVMARVFPLFCICNTEMLFEYRW